MTCVRTAPLLAASSAIYQLLMRKSRVKDRWTHAGRDQTNGAEVKNNDDLSENSLEVPDKTREIMNTATKCTEKATLNDCSLGDVAKGIGGTPMNGRNVSQYFVDAKSSPSVAELLEIVRGGAPTTTLKSNPDRTKRWSMVTTPAFETIHRSSVNNRSKMYEGIAV